MFTRTAPSCKACRFCAGFDTEQGACRRYPPVVIADTETDTVRTQFPIVRMDFWCGEFKRKAS